MALLIHTSPIPSSMISTVFLILVGIGCPPTKKLAKSTQGWLWQMVTSSM
jgi:hypothetical protein